ncbi:MAG: hypothetical protein ACYC1U_09500 [Candidatus Aquicultorales bacterium]
MGFREKLEDKIKRKEQEIQEHEMKIAQAKAYLQGLQEAIRLLPRDSTTSGSEEIILRKGSSIYKTRELLRKHGEPMHVMDILRGIGKEPDKKSRTALSGSLGFYVRQNQIFTRPDPNTFGLLEWGNGATEPPDDFGLLETEVAESEDEYEEIPF